MDKLSDEMRSVVIRHMGARSPLGKLYGRYVKATVDAAVLRWADRAAELEVALEDIFEDGYEEGFEDGQADAIESFYGGK